MAFSAKECLVFLEQPNADNIDAALVDGKIAEDKGAMVVSRIKQLNKDKKPKPSYSKLEDFFTTDTYSLKDSDISIYDNSLKINNNKNLF